MSRSIDNTNIVHKSLIDWLNTEAVDLQDIDVVRFYRYFLFHYYMDMFIRDYSLKRYITTDNEDNFNKTISALFIYILKERPEHLDENTRVDTIARAILSYDMNYDPEPTDLNLLPEEFIDKLFHLALQLKMLKINDDILQQSFRDINLSFDHQTFFNDYPYYIHTIDDTYLARLLASLAHHLVKCNRFRSRFIPIIHNFLQKIVYGKYHASLIPI